VKEKLSAEVIQQLGIAKWSFFPAPGQGEIIWEDLNRIRPLSGLKSCCALSGLFWVCIVLLSPGALVYMAQNSITELNLQSNFLFSSDLFMTYLSTGMTTLFNSTIIPLLVGICVKIEDFDTRSERQIATLNRNYFFMLINTLFLPITGSATIEVFI
jgi:hypothetical protein